MCSIEKIQESLEWLRRGIDVMSETAPQLLEQLAQSEIMVASLQSFMGETKQHLAALEEREKERDTRLAVLETNLSKALISLFPRVESVLTQLEKKEQKVEQAGREVLQKKVPVASTSKETPECTQSSNGPVEGAKKKKDKTKKSMTSDSSPTPVASPSAARADQVALDRNLVNATNCGDLKRIESLLTAGANANARSLSGKTAAGIAALMGRSDCLQVLINAGADIYETSKEGYNPLHLAAIHGKEICLPVLFATGIDIETKSQDGMTALGLSCKFGHKKVVSELLQLSADINIKDSDGRTPLHHAVMNESIECLRILLEQRPDLNSVDKDERTPFFYAFESDNLELRNIMLSAFLNSQ